MPVGRSAPGFVSLPNEKGHAREHAGLEDRRPDDQDHDANTGKDKRRGAYEQSDDEGGGRRREHDLMNFNPGMRLYIAALHLGIRVALSSTSS
jgi:hypothetical protein